MGQTQCPLNHKTLKTRETSIHCGMRPNTFRHNCDQAFEEKIHNLILILERILLTNDLNLWNPLEETQASLRPNLYYKNFGLQRQNYQQRAFIRNNNISARWQFKVVVRCSKKMFIKEIYSS